MRGPWHLWVVVVLGVLWNGFGAYDFLMSFMRGEAYFREMGMTDAQIALQNAMPVWMTGVWALGVWGALGGVLLLALRSRYAVIAFAGSLAGVIAMLVYNYLLSDYAKIMGDAASMMWIIFAGAVFFLAYALFAQKRGILH
jgi:hypothetical protein